MCGIAARRIPKERRTLAGISLQSNGARSGWRDLIFFVVVSISVLVCPRIPKMRTTIEELAA
ncbi:MAG: hypothetical protein CMO80_11305 [Verrucomicrobiales bacterium]|nr:hypothetical protein [Verrucomicrobiales bacterium]